MADREENRPWSLSTRNHTRVLSTPTLRLGSERSLYFPSKSLVDELRVSRPNAVVIDGWESPAYWVALAQAKRMGALMAIYYRGTDATSAYKSGPVKWLRSALLRKADVVLVSGTSSREHVLKHGVHEDRVAVVGNPVNVDEHTRVTDTSFRERYLYVGQLIRRKRIDVLLTAFADLAQPHARLRIVGVGPEGPTLAELARSLGIESQVEFVGAVEPGDLGHEYAQADVVVLPSEREVWGLVVNEGLAAGCHVVASTAVGATDAFSGLTGFSTFLPNDPGSLRSAMTSERVYGERGDTEAREAAVEMSPDKTANRILTALGRTARC